MKRLVMIFLMGLILAGCSSSGNSINKDASVLYIGDPVEVGTTLTKQAVMSHLETANLADETVVSVVFPDNKDQYVCLNEGQIDITIRLTAGDDILDKTIKITVQDTEPPVIVGAYDREVAVKDSIDLHELVTTRNPSDTLEFSQDSIDTSIAGRTKITVTAKDNANTVTKTFEVIVTDYRSKSDFEHFGQTYGNNAALNKNTVLVLVNKRYGLGESYVPNSLVTIEDKYAFQGRQGIQVIDAAYEAFVALNQAMVEETGMSPLSISTAYRSFGFQSTLYNNYVSSDGKDAADTYSARPGFSEHQTGLALDIAAENKNLDAFGETDQAQWVKENAARFGFVIRFPEGKERITGYQHESWHLRYVSTDYAQAIEASGLTLDEYIFAYNLTHFDE